MSQLSQAGVPSTGDRQQFEPITWAEFVELVIVLTIQAYQAMRQECPVSRDWEENTFTDRLGDDYLRPLAFEHNHSLRVSIRTKVHTQAMKEGVQPTIEAKEMDLSLYPVWERDYLRRLFVWEAKRVGDKRIDRRYTSLNSEYVNEAIYRFIQEEYAAGLSDAGVLAYVLAGDPGTIVQDINQTMGRIRKNPFLSTNNNLQATPPMNGFSDRYLSRHARTDSSMIRLHHLFLTFDFA